MQNGELNLELRGSAACNMKHRNTQKYFVWVLRLTHNTIETFEPSPKSPLCETQTANVNICSSNPGNNFQRNNNKEIK